MPTIYFITHPEVAIDPAVPVTQWPLSERGRARIRAMLSQPWVKKLAAIYCSTEQKAIDGATILAEHCSLAIHQREALGENDRSSTGYLLKPEFEATADLFFEHPTDSIRGWERAIDAQQRIINAVEAVIDAKTGDNIAIVSHGGVGTLYLCHLKNIPIDRREGQPVAGGGCYFAFDGHSKAVHHGWKPIEG